MLRTRILSALVLLPVLLGIIFYLPPAATLALCAIVIVLAGHELLAMASQEGDDPPRALVLLMSVAVFVAFAWPGFPQLDLVLLSACIVIGTIALATMPPGPDVVRRVSALALPLWYVALPIGAIGAIRVRFGAVALFVLLATVIISDAAQYFGGRAFGRSLLAPVVSPKKTREGAYAGFIAGGGAFVWMAQAWLPQMPLAFAIVLGMTLVALGIAGDLFESLLKRSAGVKDSSGLIPGHGGMLDRVDSFLFAGPVYYIALTWLA